MLNQHFSACSLKQVTIVQQLLVSKGTCCKYKILKHDQLLNNWFSHSNFQAQKPRIEKLRRDRINGSLDEIKHLVLEALNKDVRFERRCNFVGFKA